MSTGKIQPKEEAKVEEAKQAKGQHSLVIKKQNLTSFPPAYFEYFNDDEYDNDSPSICSEEMNLDTSIITTHENKDVNELSMWEKRPPSDSKEAESENSDEEIKTARVSK